MTFQTLVALIVFTFVSSITPGPNNLMVMASGANFGVRRTMPHLLGVVVGFVVMTAAVGVGLARIFEAIPSAHTVLQVASVVYLLYLAGKIATSPPPGEIARGVSPMTFLAAAAFQWVNPKAWAMALSAMSVYAPSRSLVGVAVVALAFGAMSLPSLGAWTVLGQAMRRVLTDPLRVRVFNVAMALLLVASLYPLLLH